MHTHGSLSVIVFVVDDLRVGTFKFERDTPVAANPDRPGALSGTLEGMKAKAGKSHIFRRCRRIQSAQYQTQSFSMLSLNPGFGPSLKEARQTLVSKTSNHGINCN